MIRLFRKIALAVLLTAFCVSCVNAQAPFRAFSLREAAKRAQSGAAGRELLSCGGITRFAGLVFDRAGNDIILVGLVAQELAGARLDDLAVALRARLVYDEWPLVSIDPAGDTERTGLQRVRFDGHLENTSFGSDFLDCDIILKRYSLQKMGSIGSVRPYNVLLEDDIREGIESAGHTMLGVQWYSPEDGAELTEAHFGMGLVASATQQARFWFYVTEPYVTARKEDVFCIKELRLRVLSEDTYRGEADLPCRARERFAGGWTDHFDEVCAVYPALRRLKVLYDLVAVAEAVRTIERQPYVDYFCEGYTVAAVPTDETYRLEELYGVVDRSDGLKHLVRISGGIELRTEVRMLNYGDVTPLRSVVLESRPAPDALTWTLPLGGWQMPNTGDLNLSAVGSSGESTNAAEITKGSAGAAGGRGGSARAAADAGQRGGCSVSYQAVVVRPTDDIIPDDAVKRFFGFPPPPPPPPPPQGVSMRMIVSNESFKPDSLGALEAVRDSILQSRPSEKELSWPVPAREDTNAHDKKK